jgi:hypothetical protein
MSCKIKLLEVEFLSEGATICIRGNIDCRHVSEPNEIMRHQLNCNFFLPKIFSLIHHLYSSPASCDLDRCLCDAK